MFIRFLYASVRSVYEFMAMHGGTTTDHGGIRDAHNAAAVRYGASTIKPVAPPALTIVYGLTVVLMMNIWGLWFINRR